MKTTALAPLLLMLASLAPVAHSAERLPLGSPPPPDIVPKLEFAFEERVTVDPGVVLGDTAFGHRQYIPITGGTVAGPKLRGSVVPGGWDFQLTYAASGCTQLSADYFLKAEDGTLIHVFNEGLGCSQKEPLFFRPKLEAPKGPHDWLTRATFIATLEVEMADTPAGAPPRLEAVRIRFYQVR
jgi:Protein of unknown function (DUF3237)